MEYFELLLGALIGLAASCSLAPVILKISLSHAFASCGIESRQTSSVSTSRLGGIALVGTLGAVVVVFSFVEPKFEQQHVQWLVIPTSLAMFTLGLWRDVFGLGISSKLLGQIIIAGAAYVYGIGISQIRLPFSEHLIYLGVWAGPVTVFWLVAMCNLVTLIDGVDGLAVEICLTLMIFLVYVNLPGGFVLLITAGMAGALLGLVKFNFSFNRIHLGHGGTYFLGFFLGCATIITSQKSAIIATLEAPLLLLALPIIDSLLAALRRRVEHFPWFRPEGKRRSNHWLGSVHSRRKVIFRLYGLAIAFLLADIVILFRHGQALALLVGGGSLAIICMVGKFNFSREWISAGKVAENSLEMRADIKYAISLCRGLALEGARAQSMDDLAGTVVFITRKLGFASIRIYLEDTEKTWQLTETTCVNCSHIQRVLPGREGCGLEFGVARAGSNLSATPESLMAKIGDESFLNFLADLVADGFAKALVDWKKSHPELDAPRFSTSGEQEEASHPDISNS